jgi:hypothetical protein
MATPTVASVSAGASLMPSPSMATATATRPTPFTPFRATGITAYLKNGGLLETAQQMAAHESPRTTGLYDRRSDDVSLYEVEKISI